jgi:hypothetical protein
MAPDQKFVDAVVEAHEAGISLKDICAIFNMDMLNAAGSRSWVSKGLHSRNDAAGVISDSNSDASLAIAQEFMAQPIRTPQNLIRMNWVTVDAIRADWASGRMTKKAISLKYGIHETSAGKIISEQIWPAKLDPRRFDR